MKNLNYGVIGNCKSAALVSEQGNIEWMCLPNFDSSSIFAKLLDDENGGSFEIIVKDLQKVKQSYIPRTNILVTRINSKDGIFEIRDFMPRYDSQDNNSKYSPPDVIRYFKHVDGAPEFVLKYNPRLEYARYLPKI